MNTTSTSTSIDQVIDHIANHSCNSYGLMSGKLGRTVLLGYGIEYGEDHTELFVSEFEDILVRFQEDNPLRGYSLGAGLCGLVAALHTLSHENKLDDFDASGLIAQIDEILLQFCTSDVLQGKFDYISQSGGVMLYFAIRYEATNDIRYKEYLDKIIPLVCKNMITDLTGTKYKDSLHGNEEYNLSLAHGLSGLTQILIYCHPIVDDKALLRGTIDRCVKFITSFSKANEESNLRSIFPNVILTDNTPGYTSNRLAWCYGDLNQLLLLELYHKKFNMNIYYEIIDQLKDGIKERKDLELDNIDHSQFCHGTSGLAAVYRKLHCLTGQEFYKELYNYWIERTIDQVEEDINTGYYEAHETEFLEGLVGSALVLIQHQNPEKSLEINKFFLV